MRAINLVPPGDRRGARGGAGRSGGAVYAVVGLLAVLVLVVSISTLQKRGIADKRTELAALQSQAAEAGSRTQELSSYTEFAALRARRVQTVSSIASSRFDWSHALREFARVIPSNVWLTGLQGTVNPGVSLKESSVAGTSTIRSADLSPAVEIVGCTTDQRSVARMLTRVRLIDGVSRVALQKTEKADPAPGAAAAAVSAVDAKAAASSAGADCRQGSARYPQFQFVVFFDAAAGAVPTQGTVETALVPPTGPTGPATTGVTP